ncbi:DHH family phosphoesterase [Saliterribacillus persicus]|uniref:Phosphoesterase RecJ-like protein n=1 Tax=Saliterribacillus persicus TaxID=930114 RepID=A0A368XGI6_9BACI|nr:bifunctional oligoribonuclease/PAP phosphatase NrnA [Saliterribacillus persicus]RCW66306.1 phosphoesterase RecJ-like protein [Saliterribacillus persicus]
MSKTEIVKKIEAFKKIVIHRHVRPDPDAYGSQNGLKELIIHNYPEKAVFVVGEEDPYLDFMAKMDDVPDEVFEDALVIVCDTANQARVSDQRYANGHTIIKIDHHPNHDAFGDVQWVDTSASSTSELVYELSKSANWKCSDKAASLLYGGIVGDTGRFLFPSTTDKTFHYAAELVTYKFDRTYLYEEMYKTSLNIARLKGHILQNVHVSKSGVSHVILSKDILEKYQVTSMETSAVVGVLGDIEGVVAWAIFVEEDDSIRVRLRSKGPIINELAAEYNGGGHPLASGATLENLAEVDTFIAKLDKICEAY